MSSPRPSVSATLGLPLSALVGLALLAVPRVVLHDLGLLAPGSLANALLVFVPPAVWLIVLAVRRVPRPLITALVIGLLYGVFLAIGHQVLWQQSFAGNPPQLGGNLADLAPAAEALIIRSFAVLSSLLTGLAVGLAVGALVWLVDRIRQRTVVSEQ